MNLWERYSKRWPVYTDQSRVDFLYRFISWCFNNPEEPALKFIEEELDFRFPHPYGAAGKYLGHQCQYMHPIEKGIENTFKEIIDALEIPKDKSKIKSIMKDLVSYTISKYHGYWHNYMLTYSRVALVMASTRAEFFAKNIKREEAIEELLHYGVTKEEANALLKKDYQPTQKRFVFQSQKDMINYINKEN